ncbi:hypothetical protein F5880DRAFT_1506462 [Lentinula raphanica]|nr:hypothetical protein F5880DRAFT_1506462 [Lentinula raphanica]
MAPSAASQLLAILLVATSISSGVLAAPTLARQGPLSVRQTPEFTGTPLQHRRDEHVDDLFRRNGADTAVFKESDSHDQESDGLHSAMKDLSKIVSEQKTIADRLDKIEQELEAVIVPRLMIANLIQELDEIWRESTLLQLQSNVSMGPKDYGNHIDTSGWSILHDYYTSECRPERREDARENGRRR